MFATNTLPQQSIHVNQQQHYLEIINSLNTVSKEEKEILLSAFNKIEKEATRKDFMLMRIQKDKDITTNVLNATIKDLERHKKEIEEQKSIVEEKSKNLEENLRKLELSYKELEQFSYIASHDLKSPLRTISSFAQLLKRRYYQKLDNDANEFIEFIVSGVQQMSDVIRNSLEYAKVGKDESVFEATNLNTVLNLVQLNLKEEFKSSKAKVIISKDLPTIIANKTSLLQIFQNLIGNAIKFKRDILPIIEISYQKINNNFWEFSVKDNGIGIESDYQEKVFLPFKRLHHTEKVGHGIGLAICKKIIESNGGTIRFESVVNEGTTFIFTFPIIENEMVSDELATNNL